jgi:hypothetical protein
MCCPPCGCTVPHTQTALLSVGKQIVVETPTGLIVYRQTEFSEEAQVSLVVARHDCGATRNGYKDRQHIAAFQFLTRHYQG